MTLLHYDVSNVLPFEESGRPERQDRPELSKIAPEHERFRLYSFADLQGLPAVRWLIPERLALNELTVYWGKGDTYKSFTALADACEAAAAGHTVVYIVAEGATGIAARVAAWLKHHGEDRDLSRLHFMPASVPLHKPAHVDSWLEAMDAQLGGAKPDLVVVDTLARNFVGGSENDPREMGEFVDGAERIRAVFKTAVLVIHHSGKDGKTERGTESLRNASFAMFRFEKVGSGRVVRVTCERMKDAEPPGAKTLHLAQLALPELGEDASSLALTDSTAATTPETVESAVETTAVERQVLRLAARSNRRSKGLTRADLERDKKWRRTKANKVLKRLTNGGFLRSEGATRSLAYFITERGEQVLGE